MINASILAFVLCSIKNEPNVTNTQKVIIIYNNAVPIPSKNVRKAVKIDKIRLIGNRIFFQYQSHTLLRFFSLTYVLLTTIILL